MIILLLHLLLGLHHIFLTHIILNFRGWAVPVHSSMYLLSALKGSSRVDIALAYVNHNTLIASIYILIAIACHLELLRIWIFTACRILLNVHQVRVDVLILACDILRAYHLRWWVHVVIGIRIIAHLHELEISFKPVLVDLIIKSIAILLSSELLQAGDSLLVLEVDRRSFASDM